MAGNLTGWDRSPLALEVAEIFKNAESASYDYKGVLHTEKEDIGVWDLNPIEHYRDYKSLVGETSRITFKIGLGDYTNRLYPFRDNLEFTLRRVPLERGSFRRKVNNPITVTRYKAIFNPAHNPKVAGTDLQMNPSETLNINALVDVELELLDRSLEVLRVKSCSDVFAWQKGEDVIRSVLSQESQKIKVDGKPAVDAVDVFTADNKEAMPHIIVPDNVCLPDLPTTLQKDIGIYNGSIGTFFQHYRGKKTWFVYPLYNWDRFNMKGPKAIFYMVPQERYPGLDMTYSLEGDILKVACTAQHMYHDTAELSLMNKGSGVRVADGAAFMKKPARFKDGKIYADRAALNNENVAKIRKDGLNFAPRAFNPSSNIFMQRSLVNENMMGQYDLVWENADDTLIFPGMPCKCVYLSQGQVVSTTGTILFVSGISSRIEKNSTQGFKTMLRISVACKMLDHIPDIAYDGRTGEIDRDQVTSS